MRLAVLKTKIPLVALATAAAALGACGGSEASGGDRSDVTIAVLNPVEGHPFYKSIECGARREAEKLGVEITFTGTAQYSVPNYTQVINAVAATGPDGVILPLPEPAAFFNAITNLTMDGAKVVAMGAEADDPSNLLTNIVSDSLKGGGLAGKAMLTRVGSGDEVLVIENDPANKVQVERGEGFIEVVEAAGVEVLPVQYSNLDVTKVTSIVQATLASHPDLKGIYVTNGADGPPALRVVAQEGKTDQVALVEYDASPEQVQRVRDGVTLAVVAQRPDVEGAWAVRNIVDAIDGREVPEFDVSPVSIVTQDNVDDPETQEALYGTDC